VLSILGLGQGLKQHDVVEAVQETGAGKVQWRIR